MWVRAPLVREGVGETPPCLRVHAQIPSMPRGFESQQHLGGARASARALAPIFATWQHLASRPIVSHCFSLTRLTERLLVWAQQRRRPPASPGPAPGW